VSGESAFWARCREAAAEVATWPEEKKLAATVHVETDTAGDDWGRYSFWPDFRVKASSERTDMGKRRNRLTGEQRVSSAVAPKAPGQPRCGYDRNAERKHVEKLISEVRREMTESSLRERLGNRVESSRVLLAAHVAAEDRGFSSGEDVARAAEAHLEACRNLAAFDAADGHRDAELLTRFVGEVSAKSGEVMRGVGGESE